MDGTNDRKQKRPQVAAIFVHAGAGYHSTTNEHIHLGACNDAARVAMRVLRNGGTSVDAVEAAIKILEDKEITNAGYGSNLSIDGVVECDATVVDYLGRSGACGATAQIKNPITLARVILEMSNKPLSLRRVPPNLLVGQGATDFAFEQGLPVVSHEQIVSKNARDRYIRWREDLRRAEGDRLSPRASSAASDDDPIDFEYERRAQNKQRRDHSNALMSGTWNEGQPDSPSPPSPIPSTRRSSSPSGHSSHYHDRSYHDLASPAVGTRLVTESPAKRARYGKDTTDGSGRTRSLLGMGAVTSLAESRKYEPQSATTYGSPLSEKGQAISDGPNSPIFSVESDIISPPLAFSQEGTAESPSKEKVFEEPDDDLITDTVGAIAIDIYGRIAAGSSSGGIGMKHRGRVGPAALVGVGSAVIPADEKDEELITVAAVTSGTGEHMATTMASQKCAERLYHNTRRSRGGVDIEATEEEAMESFVQADFMGHPGVSGSNSAGAIGVMAVKKTPYGYFLHFAHNTDSFAIASMGSNEKDPKCVMSRIGEQGHVVQGGRKIRVEQ
ncbi:nucleophile aminohydrolase [Bisporella sp. PMI_857]|nr:nucleophile aminohydrolase [Bisporella sp. PMI_857]